MAQILPKATPHALSLQLTLGFREEAVARTETLHGVCTDGGGSPQPRRIHKTSPRPETTPGSHTLLFPTQEVAYIWAYTHDAAFVEKNHLPQWRVFELRRQTHVADRREKVSPC